MFEQGEFVLLANSGEGGTILEVRDGTYLVETNVGDLEVSEFDIVPYEEYEDDYDFDDYKDLQPYRTMNANYGD